MTDFTHEDFTLLDLIDTSILQKMQEAFAKMARMAALTTDENGTPVTQPTNFSDFCTKYCRTSEIGCKRCEECDKKGAIMTLEQKKPVSYRCHAGLVDFAAPIMLGGRMIGSFIGGQVLPTAADPEAVRQTAREIGVPEEELVEAAGRVQIIPQAAIDRSTEFIYEFAKIISDMAFNSYVSKELSKEAMQAAIQKSDFLANMSHEIRTPMNAVLGMAEMALREDMSPEAREYIRQIQSSGKHLLVIINDILDFSKIDSGKMEIIETTYKTETLLEDISNLVNSRIGDKELDFLIDIPYDFPLELIGDNIRIQQVLINLLTNAIKFTPRGKITLRLRYKELDSNTIQMYADVKDTGNGIKKQDLDKLFKSFQQVDSKRNRNIEGTGLGLAISKQLLELMNGSISVTSEYGKGSTFSIELPQKVFTKAAPLHKPKDPMQVYLLLSGEHVKHQIMKDLASANVQAIDLSETNVPKSTNVKYFITDRVMLNNSVARLTEEHASTSFIIIDPYNSPNDLKEPNIKILRKPVTSIDLLAALGLGDPVEHDHLAETDNFCFIAPDAQVQIVDDNPINLTVAKGLLAPLKMKVDLASGASECIEQLKQKNYDLIFMDHMMPEVDGIETTHIIRQLVPGYEEVPIIALTANAIGSARELFIGEGMNDFLAKPIETKKIVAMVKKWLPPEKIVPVEPGSLQGTGSSGSEGSAGGKSGTQNVRAGADGVPGSTGQNPSGTVLGSSADQNLSGTVPGSSADQNPSGTVPAAPSSAPLQSAEEEIEQIEVTHEALLHLKGKGIDVTDALAMLGSESLYLQILKEYYQAIDKRAALIEKHLHAKDYKSYTIEVHSLKSISKQIGAGAVSGLAALLEKAGNENDIAYIETATPKLLREYQNLKELLAPLFPELSGGNQEEKPKASRESTLALIEDLIDALYEMDTLGIEDALDKIEEYEYEDVEEQNFIEQLKDAAEAFDVDAGMEIAVSWKEYLG